MQIPPDSEESSLQKELLAVAVNELLAGQSSEEKLTDEEREFIRANRKTINHFKDEIMRSQPDIRELIIQTNRIQLYYGNSLVKDFEKTESGKILTKFLNKYGKDLPMVYPSTYDKVCEDVARKTDSMKLYKQILKGAYY